MARQQKTNGSEQAFTYLLDADNLKAIAKDAGYTLSEKFHGYEDVFITGLQDKEIQCTTQLFLAPNDFEHIKYAQLLAAMEGDLHNIAVIADKISRTAVLMNQRVQTPIYRPRRHIPYLNELGIQLWHHLLFTGDYVIAFIWDTRVIDRIYTVEETKNFSKRMFHDYPYDSNEPLVIPEWIDTTKATKILHDMKPSKHPCLRSMSIEAELDEAINEAKQAESNNATTM